MSYKSFTEDPVNMAVISALIGTCVALIGTKLYDWNNSVGLRKQNLRNVKKLLDAHRLRFNEIVDRAGTDQVHPHISVQPVYNLLQGDWTNETKDSDLLNNLYTHIENIEQIARVFNIMDIRSGGFTTVQRDEGKNIEDNLVAAIPIMLANLDKCIESIPKK